MRCAVKGELLVRLGAGMTVRIPLPLTGLMSSARGGEETWLNVTVGLLLPAAYHGLESISPDAPLGRAEGGSTDRSEFRFEVGAGLLFAVRVVEPLPCCVGELSSPSGPVDCS